MLSDEPGQSNRFRKVITSSINKWGVIDLNVKVVCFDYLIVKVETDTGFMTRTINCDNIDATGSA